MDWLRLGGVAGSCLALLNSVDAISPILQITVVVLFTVRRLSWDCAWWEDY